jgi:hypothetical protein
MGALIVLLLSQAGAEAARKDDPGFSLWGGGEYWDAKPNGQLVITRGMSSPRL